MKVEPRANRDGTCVQCGKVKIIPSTRQRGVSVQVYVDDPFCSNVCAKAYYGTHDSPSEAQARAWRK